MNTKKKFSSEPALRVTTFERDPGKPDSWTRSHISIIPLESALDLPVGPDRRLIVEEIIDSQEIA
jgi:hypothetical protein